MLTQSQERTIKRAVKIIENRIINGEPIVSPEDAVQLCRLNCAALDYEVFGVLYLNTQNVAIKNEILFRGTINAASVYPREVVKNALHYEASSLILYHNHPSNQLEPSLADREITNKLSKALALMDIKIHDHLIITAQGHTSMAKKGLIL